MDILGMPYFYGAPVKLILNKSALSYREAVTKRIAFYWPDLFKLNLARARNSC